MYDGRCLEQAAVLIVLILGRRMVGFAALEKDLAIVIEAVVVAKGIKDILLIAFPVN